VAQAGGLALPSRAPTGTGRHRSSGRSGSHPRAVLDTLRTGGAGLGPREAVRQSEPCPPTPLGQEKGSTSPLPMSA
jgi:hypothetical protein